MIIEEVPNLLPIHFDHEKIKTLRYDIDGSLSVIGTDNTVRITFPTKASVAFNRQYGTPISPDGKYVFIGTWEYGLFCHDLETGQVIWKQGPGKVRTIVVGGDFLFVEMCDRGMYVRDLKSGELVKEFKMSSINKLKRLSPTELFAGPRNSKYYIYSIPTLELKQEIKLKALNVNQCLSYIILDVFYRDNTLFVKGWEQYRHGNYQDADQVWFEREVPFV